MNRRALILKAFLLLVAVWTGVAGIRALAEAQRPSAEKIARTIDRARFADWSGKESVPDATVAAQREKDLRKISEMINRLDFREREHGREIHLGEDLFPKLAPAEKRLFVNLTLTQSMNRMMQALDAMPANERRRFVKQGLEEISAGRTEKEMLRAKALGDDLAGKLSEGGLRAYFEKANIETKLNLAPLMESMNEVMQGLRGSEYGPHHHRQ